MRGEDVWFFVGFTAIIVVSLEKVGVDFGVLVDLHFLRFKLAEGP
jgi:hypothetical protein